MQELKSIVGVSELKACPSFDPHIPARLKALNETLDMLKDLFETYENDSFENAISFLVGSITVLATADMPEAARVTMKMSVGENESDTDDSETESQD